MVDRMREVIAFFRRDALIASSYRTGMVLALGSLVAVIVPVYFIAEALQPVLGQAIASEGAQYFAFLVAGLASLQFVTMAVGAIPNAIAAGIRTGTFEAMLTSPVRLPVLLTGTMAYPFAWAIARALALIAAGLVLGAQIEPLRLGVAILIWGAIVCAYLPIGILGGALLLVIRTTGPLPSAVVVLSMFLGGVYYPTSVIPSWLQSLSALMPLTYGLRALRVVLTGDAIPFTVVTDLSTLLILATILLAGSVAAFRLALNHSRRAGTLAQY